MKRLIDLSQEIRHGLVTYPGIPEPVISDALSREASRERYAPGTEFLIGRIEMAGNTGTYLDTPFHRYPDGYDLADLELDHVAGVPLVLVDAVGRTEIGPDVLDGLDLAGQAGPIPHRLERPLRHARIRDRASAPRAGHAAGPRRPPRRDRRHRLAQHRRHRDWRAARPQRPARGRHPDRRAPHEPRGVGGGARVPGMIRGLLRGPAEDPRVRDDERPRLRGREVAAPPGQACRRLPIEQQDADRDDDQRQGDPGDVRLGDLDRPEPGQHAAPQQLPAPAAAADRPNDGDEQERQPEAERAPARPQVGPRRGLVRARRASAVRNAPA